MPLTRDKILQFLETFQPASIREIGKALDLTDPAILYHIRILLQNGDIEPSASRDGKVKGRGRPTKRYRLKNPQRPQNYSHLAHILLETLLEDLMPDGKQLVLQQAAKNLLPPIAGGSSFQARIAMLVRRLSENRYAARWEAHHTGPQIIFENCPYFELASSFPEICEMDRLTIEHFLEAATSITQTIFNEGESNRQCRFSVRPG